MKESLSKWAVFILSIVLIFILLASTRSMIISSIGEAPQSSEISAADNRFALENKSSLINNDEYSFMFFSLLYTQYPDVRNQDPDKIFDYICRTKSSYEQGCSIYDEISQRTTEMLVQILSYNADMENKGIEMDVSGQMADYFNQKRAEALYAGYEFNDYLKLYYGTNETTSIRRIAEKYLSFIDYKSNIIPEQAEKELGDDYYSQKYNENPSLYNLYSVSLLIYKYPSFFNNENCTALTKEMTDVYEKIHSHDDMDKLFREFESTHPYVDAEQYSYGSVCIVDAALSYSDIGLISDNIADYIAGTELKADTAALFEIEDGLLLLYYNGSSVNDSLTYNGYVMDDSGNRSPFSNKTLKELQIFNPTPSSFPQHFDYETYEIVLEKEGLPYWKKQILDSYILNMYSSVEEQYNIYCTHEIYLSGLT